MDHIEILSRYGLVASDQAYYAGIPENGSMWLMPFPDSGSADTYPNTMPAHFSDPVYVNGSPVYLDLGAWRVFDRIDDSGTGFGATIYKRTENGKTDFMVALQGTRGPSAQDWLGNAGFGVDKWNSTAGGKELINRLSDLLKGTNDFRNNPSGERITGDIIFTGQSLGGALAEYAAYDFRKKIEELELTASFPNNRIALVTYNGLGSIVGLQEMQGTAFDPTLLAGATTRHYWVQGDIVNRLGAGTGDYANVNHLNSAGNAYRLDFYADGTEGSQPRWMSAVDAHRIETGFYAGINRSANARDFADAAQIDIDPLQITNLAKASTAFGNLYNSYDSARDGEATTRLVATLMYGAAFGEKQELQKLVSAIGQNLYRSGRITKTKYDILVRTLPDMLNDLSKSQAGVSIQMRALLLGSILDSLEQGSTVSAETRYEIQRAQALYQDTTRYPSNPVLQAVRDKALEKFDAMAGKSDEKMRTSLTVARKLVADTISDPSLYIAVRTVIHEHLDELVSLLFTEDEPIKKFVTKAAYYLVLAPGTDAIVGLSQIVGYLGDALRAIGIDDKLTTSTLQDYVGEAIASLTDLAKSIANADADFTAEYADVTNTFGEFSNWNQERTTVGGFLDSLRSFAESALALLTGSTNAYGEEVARTIEEAGTIITSAAQTLVLRPGAGPNPFDDENFDPDAALVAAGALRENGAQSFSLYLPYAAGEDGLKVKLQLTGAAAASFDVYRNGIRLSGGAGEFELTLEEGERSASFTLIALRDVDADETLGMSAQLLDAQGNPTHQSHLELNLAFDAETELEPLSPPETTRTIEGDLAPETFTGNIPHGQPYPDDWRGVVITQTHYLYDAQGYVIGVQSYDVEYHRVDDLGNFVTGAAEPGSDILNGSEGSDLIQSGALHDVVVAKGGDDHIELGEGNDQAFAGEGNDTVLGGAGDDLIIAEGGRDTVNLGEGGDYLDGGAGADIGRGGAGDDILYGNAGQDMLAGQDGSDILDGDEGADSLYAGDEQTLEALLLANAEAGGAQERGELLSGGDDDDLLAGEAAADGLFGGAGDDMLIGGGGADHLLGDKTVLYAYDSRDWLVERQVETANEVTSYRLAYHELTVVDDGAGDDALLGGGGDDWLLGGDGDDYLDGGADNDVVFGEAGSDSMVGGTGDDTMTGDAIDNASDPANAGLPGAFHGQDYLAGGAGNDHLSGNGHNDVLYGDEGDDELSGDDSVTPGLYHGADTLYGGAGADKLWGNGGRDNLYGGAGNDHLEGDYFSLDGHYHGADVLDGEAGDDELIGGGKNDVLYGGAGNDQLYGDSAGGMSLDAQYYGRDELYGEEGDDQLFGGGKGDCLYGGAGADRLEGDGADVAQEEHGDDRLEGDAGTDYLLGGGGNDILIGGADADNLEGGAGDDILIGGAGGDYLQGGEGNDTYVFDLGEAPLDLAATEAIDDREGTNTVRFDGVTSDGLTVQKDSTGQYLVLDYGAGDRLAIRGGLNGAVSRFEFSDGTALTASQLIGRYFNDAANTTSTDPGQIMLGGVQADQFVTSGGGGTISGGQGNDVMVGSGGNNTYLYEAGDGSDSITDTSAKVDANGNSAPNVLRFGAGIRPEDIRLTAQGGALVLDIGGGGAIRIENFDGQDEQADPAIDRFEFADGTSLDYLALLAEGIDIEGSTQNDIVDGTVFCDRLRGHSGDDVLIGLAGDDTLAGGTGDDVLQGGMGSDTYVFNPGDGRDTVIDGSSGNQVIFGTGLNAASIQVSQNYGEDGNLYLDLDFGNGDRLSVLNGELRGVQSFRFADGTVIGIDDMLQRLPELYVAGSAGDDRAIGTAGDDRMQGAEGNDVLDGRGGDDRLDGGRGEDALVGGDGDDMLSGGAGDDALAGGLGMDTYVFGPGFGHDTLAEQSGEASELHLMPGILPAAMDFRREGDDLLLSMKSGNDSLRISGYYGDADAGSGWTVRGADGIAQSMDDFLELVGLDAQGVSEAMEQFRQRIVADWGASLAAQGYALGDDRVARRHITQTWGAQWNPHFESIDNFESIEFRRVGSSAGGVFIERHEEVSPPVLSIMSTTEVRRADGSTRLYAADTLAMSGEGGSDRPFFVPAAQGNVGGYRIPYGAATMILKNPNGGIKGILVFPPAMPPQSPAEGTNQTETVGSTTTWRTQYGKTIVPVVTLGVGDDVYQAGSIEIVDGGDGNDWIRTEPSEGGGGSSLLYGNDGDDTLITAGGGVTGNTLIGGRGRDRLFGDNSADTYLLLEEDAVDTVIDFGVSEIAADEVRFGAGVTAASLRVLRSTANAADLADVERLGYGSLAGSEWLLLLTPDGTGAKIRLASADSDPGRGIEYVSFADGTRLTIPQLLARLDFNQDVLGSPDDDTLFLGAGNDILDGGAGDDVLSGGAGDDVYVFGRGSSTDRVDQGGASPADADVIRFAADVRPDDVSVSRDGTALRLTIDDSGDVIVQEDWFATDAHPVLRVEFDDGTVWEADRLHVAGQYLSGTGQDDLLSGTEDVDVIFGLAGDDEIGGGTGDDQLSGGEGNDVYLFGRGGGTDHINQGDACRADIDTVRFADGIAPADVTLSRTGNALHLTIDDTGEAIVQRDWYLSDVRRIARVEFADGTVWRIDEELVVGTEGDDALIGGDLNSTLSGLGGNDVLDGGVGYDRLAGGHGNDVYLFGRDGGVDVIDQSNAEAGDIDTIRFADDVLPSDIVASRVGNSLRLAIKGTDDALVQEDWFAADARRVARIEFADGTVWNSGFADNIRDHIVGTAQDDLLSGTGRDDILRGFGGNDLLDGLSGSDELDGGSGDDVLDGGRGWDTLAGGAGNDVYLFRRGGGKDIIDQSTAGQWDIDAIRFADDVLPSDIQVSREGDSLLVTISDTGDTLEHSAWFGLGARRVAQFEFADGTMWNTASHPIFNFYGGYSSVSGTEDADHLWAGFQANDTYALWGFGGEDVLGGAGGSDVLDGGRGRDWMDGGGGGDIYLIGDHDAIDDVADSGDEEEAYRTWFYRAQGIQDAAFHEQFGGQWLVDDGTAQIGFESRDDALDWATGLGLDSVEMEAAGQIRYVVPLPDVPAVAGNDYAAIDRLVAEGVICPDRVVFGPGVTADGLAVSGGPQQGVLSLRWPDGKGVNIHLRSDLNDMIGNGIERVEFVDGSFLTIGQLLTMDQVVVGSGDDDYLAAAGGNDTIDGQAGNDCLIGDDGHDRLDGGPGDDYLEGNGGDDRLAGGKGSDTYYLDASSGHDVIVETAGGDAVDAVCFGLGLSWDRLHFTRYANGNDLVIGIDGWDADVTIRDWFSDGTAGRIEELIMPYEGGGNWYELRLSGADLDAAIWAGNSAPALVSSLDDQQAGTNQAFHFALPTNAFVDSDGDRLLYQATLVNGDPLPVWLSFDPFARSFSGTPPSTAAGVLNIRMTATDAAGESVSGEFMLDIANHLAGTAGNDRLTGTTGRDVIEGFEGNDVLNGAAGTDSMIGGLGNDTYYADNVGDAVTELADEGTDRVISTVSYALGNNIENLTLSGTDPISGTGNALTNVIVGNVASNTLDGLGGDDRLTGGASGDVLLGGEGSDVLNGSGGADAMVGGVGNDTYYVDDVGDVVTELADEGTDRVVSTFSHTLGDNVENLTLTGTEAIDGTGNALNNTIVGNAASNVLDGLGGDDRLTGGASDDTLRGGDGNDVMNGSGGADAMAGGPGNDIFYVDDVGDAVTELADEGTDRVISTVSYTLGDNIENLSLSGIEAIGGTGNALNNVIVGNAAANTLDGLGGDDRLTGGDSDDVLLGGEGNDVLNGAAGADEMAGGTGNDSYYVDDAADVVTELADEGADRVISTVSYALGDNVENLTLSGTGAIIGAGNAMDNALTGNAAINLLAGGDGIDRLNGGAELDFLEGGAGNDVLADTVGAGYFNGGSGNDSLRGDSAADFYLGGAGNDSINTGTGADVIVFNLGDGQDTVAASIGADNTLSLGGGIAYSDIAFRKSGNNLILDIGASDRITLASWYAGSDSRSILTLQVIAEAMAGFDAGGADSLRDNLVERFDFAGLVGAFDAARAANPGLTSWAITDALTQFHLAGSDTSALGGDLAYQYGRNGTLAGIGVNAAQEVLGDALFGVQAQALRPLAGLQEGAARLG